MSIAQDTQAMQAKLQGNTQALQAMAAQGNMAALLALKEMLDQQQYAQSMKANAAMQTPEMEPVLNQMASGLQAAQTQRGFAEGGAPGALDFEEGEGILGRAGRRVKSGLAWLADTLQLPSQDSFKGGPAIPPPVNDTYPERAGMLHPPTGKTSSAVPPATPAAPRPAGLAAAVGAGTPKPQDTGPVPPVTIIPLPPPDATESELAAYQAQLAQFAEDRKALSAKQREMLDAQYARQAKSMTPDKGQRFWDFLANVGAVGGKNAARALAKGAVATRDAEVKRKASMEMLKAAHEKELLLLDNADQADKEGNAAKAYQLRQEAAKVKLEREKVQSTMQENASQGRLRDAQIQETNARIPLLQAQAENQRAQTKGEGRWAPKAAGALKTPTPAQRVSWIAAEKERLRKASSAPDVTDAELERQASVNVNARIATATGAAAPADGGTPARTRIKFGDL
jgi:hypothetical protein